MSRIRITVSGDGLTADVAVIPGPASTPAALEQELRDHGIVFGVATEVVASLGVRLADPGFQGHATVAHGERGEDGVDGRLEIDLPAAFEIGHHLASGAIDYRERNFLCPVRADQRIGRIVPPTAGKPGTSVRGTTTTPRPGKEARLRIGPGVRLTGGELFGTRNGVLSHDARHVDVVPLYTHAGDVDYHSGNLHSEGSLAVRGDVHSGFTVSASDDVQIAGAVLDGIVKAGGSVRVDQGVQGPDSRVEAGAAVSCRHATNATIEAKTAITIGDQAAHCRLTADSVLLHKGRGTVFGGETRARTCITVRTAGTPVGAVTRFVVGDVLDESAALLKGTLADQKLGARAQLRARGNERAGGGKNLRTAVKLQDPVLQEQLRIRQRQRELLQQARIEITDTIHAGVRVVFGERERLFTEPAQHICLRWDPDQNEIILEPLP